jgi:ubiquitin-like-conjugating enzyme ATG10
MAASLGTSKVSPFEYLLMWIGAMGKTVRLDVQIEVVLMAKEIETQAQ